MPQNVSGLLFILMKYWQGAAAAFIVIILIFNYMGKLGFIDDVVHTSTFARMQLENTSQHEALKACVKTVEDKVAQVREDVKDLRNGDKENRDANREVHEIHQMLQRIVK